MIRCYHFPLSLVWLLLLNHLVNAMAIGKVLGLVKPINAYIGDAAIELFDVANVDNLISIRVC